MDTSRDKAPGGDDFVVAEEPEVRRPRRWRVVLALVALLAPAAGVVALRMAGSGDDADAEMGAMAVTEVPPLDLTSVSAEVAGHYAYAAAHEREFSTIPCFCGCEKFLAHRSLYDCFVRADGRGWEAHGAGCAVCIGEAALASRLLEAGQSLAEVRAAVVAQYGATAVTAPAS